VAADEFGERVLIVVAGVSAEQVGVGDHRGLPV
jgi:hypothetical protein